MSTHELRIHLDLHLDLHLDSPTCRIAAARSLSTTPAHPEQEVLRWQLMLTGGAAGEAITGFAPASTLPTELITGRGEGIDTGATDV